MEPIEITDRFILSSWLMHGKIMTYRAWEAVMRGVRAKIWMVTRREIRGNRLRIGDLDWVGRKWLK